VNNGQINQPSSLAAAAGLAVGLEYPMPIRIVKIKMRENEKPIYKREWEKLKSPYNMAIWNPS
jgi:hypothetical protein